MDYTTRESGWPGTLQGKRLFRIRESHVGGFYAEHAGRHPAVVKLDLVLRGMALLPEHRGRRSQTGVVPLDGLPTWHLARLTQAAGDRALTGGTGFTPSQVAAMREHVRRQLRVLEADSLLRIDRRPGRTPSLIVCSDCGDGGPLNDPVGWRDDRYITVPGSVIASGMLASFDGARLVAFLAALVAECHDERSVALVPGDGLWFRTPEWFTTRYGRPLQTFPFAPSTLKRGLVALRRDGLIERTISRTDPITGARLHSDRALYTNRFATMAEARVQLDRLTVDDIARRPGRRP